MKILSLLLILSLASCTTNVDLQQTLPEEKHFSIAVKIFQGEDVLSAPNITVLEGRSAIIRIVEEKYLPVLWEPPKARNENGKLSLQPASPTFGSPKDFGITLKTRATKVKLDSIEDLIHIQGNLILSEPPLLQNSKFQNNELLFESLHNYREDLCNYSIFLKNGTKRKIKFNSGNKEYIVEFTVSEIDTSGFLKSSANSEIPDFKNL